MLVEEDITAKWGIYEDEKARTYTILVGKDVNCVVGISLQHYISIYNIYIWAIYIIVLRIYIYIYAIYIVMVV